MMIADLKEIEEAAVSRTRGNGTQAGNDWEDPKPLENIFSVPTFPISTLAPILRDYALAVAEHAQTPVDMVAVATLGVSSACLQGKYNIQGKIGHEEPVNNYFLLVAKSGERKSPVCNIIERPIKDYEKKKKRRAKPQPRC